MPDYSYQVRLYVDISWLPRGVGGTIFGQNQANINGYGPNQMPGTGPAGQTMRFGQNELLPNAIGTAPTVANVTTAITTAANSLSNQITPDVLAQIARWATGGE